MDDLLTVDELAARWRCHRNTVHRLVRDGRITSLFIGRARLFRARDVEAFEAERERGRLANVRQLHDGRVA